MNAINTYLDRNKFRQGGEVVLVRGWYQGTPDIFFRLKGDPAWAQVTEATEPSVSHPVEWLAHSNPSNEGELRW